VVGAAGGVSIVSGTLTQGCCNFPAEDGAQYLDLTGDGTNAVEGVEQTTSTTPGTSYTLLFWVGNVNNPGNLFGSTTTIDFLNGDPAGDNTNGLDNVSINVTSAAPEPGTLSFFALAAAIAGALRLRRKRGS